MNTSSVPTVPTVPTLQFSERTLALTKRQAYAFSMDLSLALTSGDVQQRRRGRGAASHVAPGKRSFTYHVTDEVLVNTVDGIVRDVPVGTIVRADEILTTDADGVASVDGRVLLELDADIRATISMAYTGVLNITGGVDRIFQEGIDLQGSAFVALRSECEVSKFRWMVETQLFGFGRLHAHKARRGSNGWECAIDLSYDFYSAG